MNCRPGCGACCIAPSITSFIPGMPEGKPAGVPCIQLDNNRMCKLFNKPERPEVCLQFSANTDCCGSGFEDAMEQLVQFEVLTAS